MEPQISTQRELALPLKLSDAQALGLKMSDLKPVTLHGRKLRGVYTSKRHTQTVTVPQWADAIYPAQNGNGRYSVCDGHRE